MTYSSNLTPVLNTVNLQLTELQQDKMTRLQAISLMAAMKHRIHVDGRDSNGTQIGTYTPAYVKYARKKAGRGTDNKVIISLTRQLESGYQLEAIPHGWAICLRTAEDMQKARWCEETYNKPIFAPTAEEKAMVIQIANDFIAKHTAS
ncbi:MAG: hypothetical protein IKN59_01885 [Paludibacteraceae bacterium]|nr:hypothetical protein [Paludibacteraceae bacterium]